MQLNALLLADAVSAPPDGKFYIHGGGLTRLAVPVLPFAVPQLGVFVRLEIDAQELGGTHEFAFELNDPDGHPVAQLPQFTAALPTPPTGTPLSPVEGEQRFVVLAVNMGGITVGHDGLHHFRFSVDGKLMGEIPLPVVVFAPEQLQAAADVPLMPRPPVLHLPPQQRRN